MTTENVTLLTRSASSALPLPLASTRRHPAASIAKRGLDIAVSALALVLLLPVLLVVALAVFISSPGKVTFRQHRVGFAGERFKIIKFRSMVADSERRLRTDAALRELYLANDFKIPAHLDTRITRVGRLIRSTSLDELPQFWNVLMGHMSLVGPRPVLAGELDRYGEAAGFYESVRPGLTGAWQASGRSKMSYPERVRLDVDYVTNWSFWNDLVIIVKTVPAVLRRHGAH